MAGPVEIVPIIVLLLLFVGIMVVFSQEKLDYVAYSLLAAFIAVMVTIEYFPDLGNGDPAAVFLVFVKFIEFEPIIFLISMQVIVQICEKHKIVARGFTAWFYQW